MKIDYLFEDGANFQAQIVALIIKSQREFILTPTWNRKWGEYEGRILIGRLENCREQGYVLSLSFNGNQRNYGIYEHRNIDDICILINDMNTINTPTMEQIWEGKEDKYNYDKSFGYGEWNDCAKWIGEDMKAHLSKWVEERNAEKEVTA
jgi:hypothetical protein